MEYYSAIKRNGVLTQTTTWVNLEVIVLSEINETQKDVHCRTPLEAFRMGKSIETESTIEQRVMGAGGEEKGELLLKGYRVFMWDVEKPLEILAMVAQHC